VNSKPATPWAELAFVALGSNLGDSRALMNRALVDLRSLSDQPLLQSSLWRTTPVDCPPGSPLFLNAVAGLVPGADETPETLLAQFQRIERVFGRQPRHVRNEPRPIDLDLLSFRREVRATASLTLPHPRAHLRRFVLEPLNEIAPDLILPRQTKSVRQLLAELETDEVVSRII
jgi:2-amino-4-hydroxy-6-hydroxymethyldihydropteridine diphosphokinase